VGSSVSPTPSPPGGCVVGNAAGSTPGFADGPAATAQLSTPAGVALWLPTGAALFTDRLLHRIRALSAAGVVTTLAGSGSAGASDGAGTTATFSGPDGIAFDAAGNAIVADSNNHRLRRVAPTGSVATIAGGGGAGWLDGPALSAAFNTPTAVAVDAGGGVFVADRFNHRVRYLSPSGAVSTLAGSGTAAWADGTGTAAAFNAPSGLALDGGGAFLWVADGGSHRLRTLTLSGALVATVAGSGAPSWLDGAGASAAFSSPRHVCTSGAPGAPAVVADAGNARLRSVAPTGEVTTILGTGAAGAFNGPPASLATLNNPWGCAVFPATGAVPGVVQRGQRGGGAVEGARRARAQNRGNLARGQPSPAHAHP